MRHEMPRSARAWIIAALALSCASCSSLFGGKERTPPAIYVLSLDPAATPPHAGSCGALQVSEPDPAPGFSSARMVYQRQPHRLEPFAFARWAEPPAPMMQDAMVRALERSGLFSAVLAAPAAVPPDYSLESDALSVLQSFDGGTSQTVIELSIRLVDLRKSRLLAVQRLSASVPAEANPAGGVAAANRALAQVLDQLVGLTRNAVDCSGPAPPRG
jgi:ABC-type uncharacterized transport system auxiliary subunit